MIRDLADGVAVEFLLFFGQFIPGKQTVVQPQLIVAAFTFVTGRLNPAIATFFSDPAIVFRDSQLFRNGVQLCDVGRDGNFGEPFSEPKTSRSQLDGNVVGLLAIRFLEILAKDFPGLQRRIVGIVCRIGFATCDVTFMD